MAIAMVAMLAFGGTYAYFTASATAAGGDEITTGTIVLDSTGVEITNEFTGEFAVPGDKLWSVDVTLTEKVDALESNVKRYMFATWGISNENSAVILSVDSLVVDEETDEITGVEGWKLAKNEDGVCIYYVILEADDVAPAFKDSVSLSTATTGVEAMNQTISCSLSFKAVQYDHASDETEEVARALEAYNI